MFRFNPEYRWPLFTLFLCVFGSVWWMHSGWVADGIGGGFHPGHVWAADHVASMVSGEESWTGVTRRIGFPEATHLRLIAWVPLLLAVPAGWVLGTPAALWLMIVLGLFATGVATMILIRRVFTIDPWAAMGASFIYTFCPFSLGVLANGQLAKMQLWCLPLLLLFADHALQEDAKKKPLVWLFLSSVVLGFNAPSIGLVMPIALVVWVMFRTPTKQDWTWAIAVLGVAAAGMLPAWWMHTAASEFTVGLLPAAPVPGLQSPPHLSPVATASGLLGLHGSWDGARSAVNNVAALGWPAVLAGVACLWRGSRMAWLGAGLCVAGVLLALGPSVEAAGMLWLLPAEVLDRVGYPLQESGMYYRFVQVASLGLALCGAAISLRWPKHVRWIAIGIGLGVAVDAYRVTSGLWPRSIRSIPHRSIYTSMAEDSVAGAVLELPLAHLDTEGERRLVGQLIHGRPTTALARNMVVQGQPRLERLSATLRGSSPQQMLNQLGIRYVLLHGIRTNVQLYRDLSRSLGKPQEDGGLAVWVVSQ